MNTSDISKCTSIAEVWEIYQKDNAGQAPGPDYQSFVAGAQSALSIIYAKRGIAQIPEGHNAERALWDELREMRETIVRASILGPFLGIFEALKRMDIASEPPLPPEVDARVKADIAAGIRNEDGTCKDPDCPFCETSRDILSSAPHLNRFRPN
jgi:hypothetical protein